MRVQIDRYNPDVLIPVDPQLGYELLFIAVLALFAALLVSGIRWRSLVVDPLVSFRLVLVAATRRGGSYFWLFWVLNSLAVVFIVAGILILVASSVA